MTTFYFDAPHGAEIPRFEAMDLAERNVKWRLFRHFVAPRMAGESWLLNDGTYTLVAPSDPATVVLHFSGGRTALTPSLARAMLDAGQSVLLPDGQTVWDPAVGLTWAQAGQLSWGDLSFFEWSEL